MKDFSKITAYELLKTEELPDLKGTGYYLRHKKSGARIAYIANEDDNKVFAISFRTPPTDSTGVAHIIEHTVLCGSEHFPAKDPFIELAKGSLNTFLNALTASDRTMYPVASCNMQDFKNLMHVYLDAVFYPNIYKREEIFKQEGWHYELENEDAELIYNGIVYSEMKGAFSSPEQVLFRVAQNSLFPDTAYGVESGGDPDCIPDLTYADYLDFHRRYYHPVNSYIYLYGDLDIEERLDWMDREYLSKFDRITLDSSLKKQEPFGGFRQVSRPYSVEEEKEDGSGAYYAYNVIAGDPSNLLDGYAFEVLDQVLFSAPGAPVKQALLDAGIGEDFISSYDGEALQPYYMVCAKNAKTGQKDRFVEVLRNALEKCVKEGLKESSLLAAINAQEFRYKEADFGAFPKGLLYGLNALGSWLYDDDQPFRMLHGNAAYKELKQKIGTGYFEELIQKYLLDSKHGSVLEMLPKAGLNAEKEAALKKKLAEYKASLSKEEVTALVEATKALKAYQDEPSTKEQLESIPLLSISDIEKSIKKLKNEEFLQGKLHAVWHNIFTNGISYITALFDVSGVTTEEVPYVGLLSDVLANVDTRQHGYQDLNDEINTYTGGFSTELVTYTEAGDHRAFHPGLSLSIKTFSEETGKAMGFVDEIIGESLFTDSKRINEILLEVKSKLEMMVMRAGHAVAISRANSYLNQNAAFEDASKGVSYYEFIQNLINDYENKKEEIARKLEEVAAKVFTKENVIVSLTANESGRAAFEQEADAFLAVLKDTKKQTNLTMPLKKKNEGFKTPGQVQYVIRGGNYKDHGFAYHGSYAVLSSLLGYGYLWNEIRVKGGAYGAGILIQADGLADTYSYRDPNLMETNQVYEGLPEYVGSYEADEREMTKNILGTMSNVDTPLNPKAEGARSFRAYLSGRTEEMLQKVRDEILATTVEDIRAAKPMLAAVLSDDCICTVGSAAKLEECKELFCEVKSIF